jgi:hypothetical protein
MLENDNVSDRDNMNDQYNEDRERMTKKIEDLQRREKNILQQLLKYQNANKR